MKYITQRASKIEVTYKDIVAMTEDAKYVFCLIHFDFLYESGDVFLDAT